jgi:hypothetical protein
VGSRRENYSPNDLVNKHNARTNRTIWLLYQLIGRKEPCQRLGLPVGEVQDPWQMAPHCAAQFLVLPFFPECDLSGERCFSKAWNNTVNLTVFMRFYALS